MKGADGKHVFHSLRPRRRRGGPPLQPSCWRTRMALAHKSLEVETVPWRFTEKDKLPKPNRGRVPVIVDDDRVVHDSTATADHLEERYPDRPALFGG